jgi:hypothetical protein
MPEHEDSNHGERMLDDDDERRLARNEALFRDVNESIARGQWPGDEGPVAYRCECARLGCNDLISLTPREYAEIRSNGRRFVIAPGHEIPELETVVATGAGYKVVEKRAEAGRVAEETNPRD